MHLKKVTLHPEKYPTQGHYPFNLDLFQKTQAIILKAPVTFFVGENGSGKSTLLEAITRKCGIYIWQGMQRPRFNASPYEKDLYKTIEIEWTNGQKVPGSFFGSQIFNNFAQILDDKAHCLSTIFDPRCFSTGEYILQSEGEEVW